MRRINTTTTLLLVTLGLAACSSTPIEPAADTSQATPVAAAAAPAPAPAPAAPMAAPTATVVATALPEHLDPKSSLSLQRSVYFDFEVYSIPSTASALIERHGKYLVAHPTLAIRIEGNTDERGGAEYNLALGQKRAESVLRALKLYGVKDAQLEAVSWGESKPRDSGHDEAAWAQNRRADLQYPKQ